MIKQKLILKLNKFKSKIVILCTICITLTVVGISSLYLLQHQAISSAQLISDDIGNDLTVSNFALAERRIEILRHMGQTGLSLKIQGDIMASKTSTSCLSQTSLPISVDGIVLAEISNCISLDNLSTAIAHSPSVITLFMSVITLLLAAIAFSFRLQRVALETKKNQEMTDLYRQVAHDIRSPLSALEILLDDASSLPIDQQTLLKHSISRINDIANTLLKKGIKKNTSSKEENLQLNFKAQHLASLIDSIISEKRAQYGKYSHLSIQSDITNGFNLFSKFNSIELSRILSNIINNSVEALPNQSGKIHISLTEDNHFAIIKISDNGKGIHPDIITKLGVKGFSHGKTNSVSGSGLGIYHAKKTLENNGGEFSISSTINKGTDITLKIPKYEIPNWFHSKISLNENPTIVILDDDISIHSAWESRLRKAKLDQENSKIFHFFSISEFETWVVSNKADLYLIDFEIQGLSPNGLDVIERNNLKNNSILVTSRFEEPSIQKKVESLGISIIPKNLLPLIPISTTITNSIKEVILLDDDLLIRTTWQHLAKKAGVNLKIYSAQEELFKDLEKINSHTTFYIDNYLTNGVLGTDVARKLYDQGFTELYLETGCEPEEFSNISFIKGVTGKTPRWNVQ
jgi:signal transduction histidine kinase